MKYKHTVYRLSVTVEFSQDGHWFPKDLSARGYTSVKVILSYNRGLWYCLLLSTRHYISELAQLPPLMPSGTDSVATVQQFSAEGWYTESVTVWQRSLLWHRPRFFYEYLLSWTWNVSQQKNVLVVNWLFNSAQFSQS